MGAELAEADSERVAVDADDFAGVFDAVFDEEDSLVDFKGLDGIPLKPAKAADVGVADLTQILQGGLVGDEGKDFLEARLHASM